MFKLQAKTAGEAPFRSPQARLEGDRLAVVSAEEQGKWPTDLAGLLLGALLQAMG